MFIKYYYEVQFACPPLSKKSPFLKILFGQETEQVVRFVNSIISEYCTWKSFNICSVLYFWASQYNLTTLCGWVIHEIRPLFCGIGTYM